MKPAPRFNTITGVDWRQSLRAARIRRAGACERIRKAWAAWRGKGVRR
jgi:hypothetical protein